MFVKEMEQAGIVWFSRKEREQENPIEVYISEINNGLIFILSDKGPRLGTIAIGTPMPLPGDRINTASIPIVFGIRNELLSRAIAERVARACSKLVIASVYLSNESAELAQHSLQFAEKSIHEFILKTKKPGAKK
jgi:hypothetical protein